MLETTTTKSHVPHGLALLNDPALNKGTAFTVEELRPGGVFEKEPSKTRIVSTDDVSNESTPPNFSLIYFCSLLLILLTLLTV